MQAYDQNEIRNLVSEWMTATKRGDTQSVLNLMAEDALFLVPGQPPMDKAAFAKASRSHTGAQWLIESNSDIKEVQVEGNTAWMWSHLTVDVTPPGAPTTRRQGHTLTVFRKVQGKWLLARDANLLVKV